MLPHDDRVIPFHVFISGECYAFSLWVNKPDI